MANDPQTFAALQASVARWLDNDTLTERIPEFIALAERRFNRILNAPEMEATATLTAAASVVLPSDLWEIRAAWIERDPRQPIEEVTQGILRGRYGAQVTGLPQVFALSGGSMLLGPAPDAAYALVLTYKQTIPALSDAVPTNWLLTRHPDIYLWAALLAAEAYLVNDERLGVWKGALDEAIDELMQAGNRKRFVGRMRLRSPVAWGG
jgi:hypothetical protein